MFNFLLVTFQEIFVPLLLVVFVVVLYLAYSLRNKRYMQKVQDLIDNLKPGSEIKTYSGVYGKVVKLSSKGDIKTVLIQTGDNEKTTFWIDAAAIANLENVVETKEKEVEEIPQNKPEVLEEEKVIEQKPKNTTKKKTTK